MFWYVDLLGKDVSYKNKKRFIGHELHAASRGERIWALFDIQVWVESERTSRKGSDEDKRFPERLYDTLSRPF